MSIYAHFASKDGLICAVLHEVQTTLLGNLRSHARHSELPAIDRLKTDFNILCFGMSDPEVRAGLGVRALLEFPQVDHPVHQTALDLERAILNFLEPVAQAADISECEVVVRELLLLAKGCYVMSPTMGLAGSRIIATGLAEHVLQRGGVALEFTNREVLQS